MEDAARAERLRVVKAFDHRRAEFIIDGTGKQKIYAFPHGRKIERPARPAVSAYRSGEFLTSIAT